MYPALYPGEMFFANGLDRTPTRGAVMVFHFPERRQQLFDKRVIGLPGDVMRTNGKSVFLNDWEILGVSSGNTPTRSRPAKNTAASWRSSTSAISRTSSSTTKSP